MTKSSQAHEILAKMGELCPAGFAIGMHLEFTTSRYIFQTYPKSWMEEYSRKGLIVVDPTVRWGVENLGWIRWSDLSAMDEGGVIKAAATYGLTYGVSIAIEATGTRTLGSFAHSEREFTESEINDLSQLLTQLHEVTGSVDPESDDDKALARLAGTLASVQ
ncbi:MAG: autoinducer binding domain-containing protein [Pseudomonadota bacterium]